MTRATAAIPSPRYKKKTDNQNLADKCVLRRKLILEAHLEPLRVLDLFAGEGHIWSEMRKPTLCDDGEEMPHAMVVEKYTPIDSATKQMGQIKFKITPRLIESLDENNGLSRYNTIDIDTYGDPFVLWHEVLFRIRVRTAVFLTRGRVTYGAGRMPISKHAKKLMGIPAEWDVPGKIELLEYGDRCQLLEPCPTAHIAYGYWMRSASVDYYALLVEPTASQT